MLEVGSHNGGCCGRYHISNFFYGRVDHDVATLKEILSSRTFYGELEREDPEREDEYELSHMCAEICLTTEQLWCEDKKGKTLEKRLLKMGFEEVYRFINPNSKNTVVVFLYSEDKVSK